MSQDLIFNFESNEEYNTNSVVNFYIGTSDDNLSDTNSKTDSDWTDIISKSDNEIISDKSTDDESNKNIVKKITKTYYNVNNIDTDDSDYEYINTSINKNKINQNDISKIIIKKTITKNNIVLNNKIISSKQTTTSEIKFYYN